ncbi:MAG: TonB family protein [Candidatus Saccharicenans sp.]
MKKIMAILKGKRLRGNKDFKEKPAARTAAQAGELWVAGEDEQQKVRLPGIFGNSFFIARKNFRLILLAMPLSVFIHLLAGALLIGVPLMNPGNLPPVQVYSAFLAPVPPPAPPPPPPKGSGKVAGKRTPIKQQPAVAPGVLVAPVDIPEEIPEEGPGSYGSGFGVPWGIEYEGEQLVFSKELERLINLPVEKEEEPVRAIGEIKPPRLIRRVDPVYPEIARQIRKEGIVIIEATTDIFGRVQSVRVLRSEPFLDEAAIEAVKQWVYEPMIINGRPRSVTFTVTVVFKLQK